MMQGGGGAHAQLENLLALLGDPEGFAKRAVELKEAEKASQEAADKSNLERLALEAERKDAETQIERAKTEWHKLREEQAAWNAKTQGIEDDIVRETTRLEALNELLVSRETELQTRERKASSKDGTLTKRANSLEQAEARLTERQAAFEDERSALAAALKPVAPEAAKTVRDV